MDENQNTKKNCGNCKYFVKYYINYNGRFVNQHCGHCICDKLKRITKKRIYYNHFCGFWESNTEKTERIEKSVENAIYKMAETLDHYIQTLQIIKR